jgi:hypothetical protein
MSNPVVTVTDQERSRAVRRRPAEPHRDADAAASDVLGPGVRALAVPVQDALARPIMHGQNMSASGLSASAPPTLNRRRLHLVEAPDAEIGG